MGYYIPQIYDAGNFPYCDTHTLNLDWILKKIKELEDAIPVEPWKITGQLSEFKGDTIEEKIENWLSQDEVKVVTGGEITITRPITVGGDPNLRDHILVDSTITLITHMFSTQMCRFMPSFANCTFLGQGHYISLDSGYIGLNFTKCNFRDCGIFKSTAPDSYAQSLYCISCNFEGQSVKTVDTKLAYDTKIIGCRFESTSKPAIDIQGGSEFAVVDFEFCMNLAEGFPNTSCIILGDCLSGRINGNYFEQNGFCLETVGYIKNLEFCGNYVANPVAKNVINVVGSAGYPVCQNNCITGNSGATILDNSAQAKQYWWKHMGNISINDGVDMNNSWTDFGVEYSHSGTTLTIPFKMCSNQGGDFTTLGANTLNVQVLAPLFGGDPQYCGFVEFNVGVFIGYNIDHVALRSVVKVVNSAASNSGGEYDSSNITVTFDDDRGFTKPCISGKIVMSNVTGKPKNVSVVDRNCMGTLAITHY